MAEKTSDTAAPAAPVLAESANTTPASGRAALQAAQARVAELEAQVKDWAPKVGQFDALQAQFDQARADWAQREAGWGTERAVLRAGIMDPEAVEIVTLLYGKVQAPGEGQVKPSLPEWLGARDALPKAIQAYLPVSGEKPQEAPKAPVVPNPNRGATGTGAPGGGSFTPQALNSMGPEAYRANREAVLASLGKR